MNFDQLLERASTFGHASLAARTASGDERVATLPELVSDALALARRLRSAGLRAGMQVALQAANGYEYIVWDLALISLRAVLQALPEELDAARIGAIAERQSIALWVSANPANLDGLSHTHALADTLNDVPIAVDTTVLPVGDDDLHSRVYSSGTSGYLKGLNIGRRATELLVTDFIADFGLCESDAHLIFLPLSNYQQRLSVYGCLWAGASIRVIHHTAVFQEMGRSRPTFIIAPPAIYENVFNLFGRGGDAREKLSNFLGGNIRFMITGMAPIRADVLRGFNEMGFLLLEAYGVTETGMIAWNTHGNQKLGSVGRPIHRDHVEFTPESEIIIRRPYPLSKGYFDSQGEDSANTYLPDGSIATGDIGSLDSDGYLTLSGRKKEIIVTSGGAKFHPEEVEQSLLTLASVRHAIVMPSARDGRLTAVLVVDEKAGQDVLASIDTGIASLNQTVPGYRAVQRKVFTHVVPTIDNGMLTRNLKYNRKGVYRFHQQEIEA